MLVREKHEITRERERELLHHQKILLCTYIVTNDAKPITKRERKIIERGRKTTTIRYRAAAGSLIHLTI